MTSDFCTRVRAVYTIGWAKWKEKMYFQRQTFIYYTRHCCSSYTTRSALLLKVCEKYLRVPRGHTVTSRYRVHFGRGRGQRRESWREPRRESRRGIGPERLRQFPAVRGRWPYRPVGRSPDALLVDFLFLKHTRWRVSHTGSLLARRASTRESVGRRIIICL